MPREEEMPNLEDFSVEMLRELVKKHREAVEEKDRVEQLRLREEAEERARVEHLRLREEADKIVESIKILLIEAAKKGETQIVLERDGSCNIFIQMHRSSDIRDEVEENLSHIGLRIGTSPEGVRVFFEMNPQD